MPMIHNSRLFKAIAAHTALLLYSALALLPVLLIIVNSFKDRLSIFSQPYAFPTADTFTLDGYRTLYTTARFDLFFVNSFLVTASPKISEFPVWRSELPAGSGKFLKNGGISVGSARFW